MEIHVPAYNDNIVSLHSDNVNGKCASDPSNSNECGNRKENINWGLLNWSNTNCPKEHIKNCVADSKENY